MSAEPISDVVISRLPLYLRMLEFLEREGKHVTSSQELAGRLGFSSAQIRKDLSYFGGFGKQGTGYEIGFLQRKLREILQVNVVWDVILVGAGDLGSALARYQGFFKQGFHLVAVFDNGPQKIGLAVGNLIVQDMTELPRVLREKLATIAILAVPAEAAQDVSSKLVELGIRAILNYAPITLSLPTNIRVYNVDPVAGLQNMAYYLK